MGKEVSGKEGFISNKTQKGKAELEGCSYSLSLLQLFIPSKTKLTMRLTKLLFVLVAILAIIYIFGLTIAPGNCSQIGECKQCWSTEPTNVTSELCPSAAPCIASPAQQQHNAVVDVLLCACGVAKDKEYSDTNLNKEIETVLSTITEDKAITAKQVCDSTGFLTKRQYG